MPIVDDEHAPPSITTHAKLAAERAAADEKQRQTFSNNIAQLRTQTTLERRAFGTITPSTRNEITTLFIATTATAYRNFSEGSKDLEEALQIGQDLASKTGLDFDARAYDRRLKEIKRLSWSQYSQEQFETKIENYIAKELARLSSEEKRKLAKAAEKRQRRGGLESIQEVEEMAMVVGLTFESAAG